MTTLLISILVFHAVEVPSKAAQPAGPANNGHLLEAKKGLLERVERAYGEARGLRIELQVAVSGQTLRVRNESLMTKTDLISRTYFDGRLTAVVEWRDGIVLERRIGVDREKAEGMESRLRLAGVAAEDIRVTASDERSGLMDVQLRYPAPTSHGTDDFRLNDGLDNNMCLVGSSMKSWIGSGLEGISFLRETIQDAEMLPSEEVNGVTCDVVRRKRRWDDGYIRWDDLYFSPEGFLVRWDTLTSENDLPPSQERRRDYRVERISEPAVLRESREKSP